MGASKNKAAAAAEQPAPAPADPVTLGNHPQPEGKVAAVIWPMEKLRRWAANPRKNAVAIQKAKTSIRRFGFGAPLLARLENGEIIAGHTRIAAADELGLTELPVRFMSLTPDEAHALALADNKIGEFAEWDDAGVAAVLREFRERGVGIDGTGFSELEVETLLKRIEGEQSEQATRSLAERFGVPPFSVLDARQGYWQERKRAWIALGIKSEVGRDGNLLKYSPQMNTRQAGVNDYNDARVAVDANAKPKRKGFAVGSGRAGAFRIARIDGDGETVGSGERARGEGGDVWEGAGTSIFDPVLCELAYRWFCPPGGAILDPFAGGSVRGVVAGLLGRKYLGIDLRAEQVEANRAQASAIVSSRQDAIEPEWIAGDSRDVHELAGAEPRFDLVFSCPPYADLERYSEDPRDLSTLDYEAFIAAYREIIAKTVALLKPDRFAVFVVGDVRDHTASGYYRGFVPDTIAAFEAAGARYYNEAILITSAGTLPLRAGKIFQASRKLGKTHQNVLVFCKGTARKAADAIGKVDFGMIDPEPEGEPTE